MKFHVSPKTLLPGECSAQEGNCPFKDETAHYDTFDEARIESERRLEEKHGISVKGIKKSYKGKVLRPPFKFKLKVGDVIDMGDGPMLVTSVQDADGSKGYYVEADAVEQ